MKCLGFSFGLHLLGIATLLFISTFQGNRVVPIVIDLTLADLPSTVARQPENRGVKASLSNQAAPSNRKPLPQKELVRKVQQVVAPVQSPPTVLPVEQKPATETGKDRLETLGGEEQAAGGKSGIPSSVVSSTANNDASAGNERQRYLAEHFSYIRNLVRKHLVYPTIAQRMGWGGKAVVSFIIMENGTVENIRLVESSGIALLDRSALETIKRAAPFPRPPVRAEIVLPVLFKLM